MGDMGGMGIIEVFNKRCKRRVRFDKIEEIKIDNYKQNERTKKGNKYLKL